MGKVNVRHSVLVAAIIIAAFGQPNGLYLLLPGLNFIQGALFLTLLCFILAVSWKQKARVSTSFILFLFIVTAFMGWSFISLLYAEDKVFGLTMIFSMSFKVLLVVIIVLSCTNMGLFRSALKTVSYLGLFFSATGILLTFLVLFNLISPSFTIGETDVSQSLSYNQGLDVYLGLGYVRSSTTLLDLLYPRLQGYFIEPGYFAFFIEMSLFCSFALKTFPKGERPRRLGLIIGLQVLALVMSLSLGGMIAVLLGYVFFKARTTGFRIRRSSFPKLVAGMAVVIVFVGYLLIAGILQEAYKVIVSERFETDYGKNSADTRSMAFQTGLNFFQQRPLSGWGMNQTRFISGGSGTNDSFMTVLVELGIPGGILYLALIVILGHKAFSRNKRGSPRDHLPFIRNALGGGFLAMLFHTFLIDAFWSFQNWIMIGFVFSGYCLNKVHEEYRDQRIHAG